MPCFTAFDVDRNKSAIVGFASDLSMSATEQLERSRRTVADLRKRLAELQAADSDTIAVVGMACRFPGGARDCDGYWRMVAEGRDAIRPIPVHRARYMAADNLRPVALLDDIETFDAAFFDISPREAVQMDPQQRLFLEVAWEALEDAGQTRSGLIASPTGVFVGVHNHSSGYLELQTAQTSRLNEYTATGSGHDVIAGRLAYVLDLRGPSVVINTACSSSLVAVHMACQSLQSRDCRMAVAGGVNLILGPMQGQIVSLGAMLAADGRCKTFDSRADGYGRGEGCGAIVLKRLSDARVDRDRILAIIRASAVNQDGRTNGLTAPNGLSQQALLRRTLARAGLEASRIGYVEAHGTGTALGDPIEVEAIASVYGMPAEGAARCGLGSAKSNINHLEGAAGIAGLIRAILILRARLIPPVAGLEHLNPHLSLEGTRLFIPTEPVEWQSEAPRLAAVSAFGWSGVNAHVVVEEATVVPPECAARPTMVMISAPDAATLSARAMVFAEELQNLPSEILESFAWTATARRSHYEFRLAVAGAHPAELGEALRNAACRQAIPVRATPAKIGFLIGDDNEGTAAFGGELMAEDESFRSTIRACAATFGSVGEAATTADSWLDFTAVPDRLRVFVFAVGVAAMLERWGVRPAVIAGWGLGALAAAHLSGDITLTETVRRIAGGEGGVGGSAKAAAQLAQAKVDHTIRLDRLSLEGSGTTPGDTARLRLMQILADLVVTGTDLSWNQIFGSEAQLISLPAHRFRRRRYWVAEPPPSETELSPAAHVPDDWFHETLWQPGERPFASNLTTGALKWLILGEAHGPAARLAAFVRGNSSVALVESSVDPDSGRLVEEMGRGRWAIVDLRAFDRRTGPVAADAMRLTRQLVVLDRALDRMPTELEVRIWIVTRGVQSLLAGEAPDLAAVPLWGLGRSLILDHPERWGGFVDLDPGAVFDPGTLHGEIVVDAREADEIAFRDGCRYVNRLVSAAAPADTLRLDPAATYLVVGAFGGIGPALAVWLAGRGAKSLVLTSRSLGENKDGVRSSISLKQTLQEMGVEALLEPCDVGDQTAVSDLFERIRRSGRPLRGIFHAAAAATDRVDEIQESDLEAAFRPKVDGALFLDAQSRFFDLDFFVLFSSAAGVLGARAQGHYAAANAFLDALATSRRAEGLPGLSIDWGLWDENDAPRTLYYRRVGLNPMAPTTAFNAMARLMSKQVTGNRDPRPLVASMDERLRSALELRGRGLFLSALAPGRIVREADESLVVAARFREMPATLRRGMVADIIAAEVRAVMELSPKDKLSVDRGFFDLGMNSLMTVALKARLEDRFGMKLSSTLAVDYPSVAALAGYFEDQFVGLGAAPINSAGPNAAACDSPPSATSAMEELSNEEVAEALAAELRALDQEARE
jgi:acyl transferase domain-containing protein/acyl carrier protein